MWTIVIYHAVYFLILAGDKMYVQWKENENYG